MSTFTYPQIPPFQIPERIGHGSLVSSYLPNIYNTPYTNIYWRKAIDRAILFSDMSYLDPLYSWCIQCSPFLVSMLEKRTGPAEKKTYVFKRKKGVKGGGRIMENETQQLLNTRWFRSVIREIILAKAYGVRVCQVDPVKDSFTDFPLRNIDTKNRAIRIGTYQYYQVAEIDKFDNVFYFQPSNEQDFQLGWLQPISRSMIAIQDAYTYWSLTGMRFSYPQTVIGFLSDNPEAESIANDLAQTWSPSTIAVVPFTRDSLTGDKNLYQIDVNTTPTQAYPDAFRVFKEEIASFQAEVMQLLLGGTLLGATEKNTNSEELANLHLQMYNDKLQLDERDILYELNQNVLPKLQKLVNINLSNVYIDVVPDKKMAISDFIEIGKMMSSQGMRYSAKAFEKVGIDPEDLDMDIRHSSWGSSLADSVKKVFSKKKPDDDD